MTINDWLMIGAVLFSPFLAVFAQRKIDQAREKRNQKLWIFRTLMATRGNRLHLDHVQALNMIELFFNDRRKDKRIIEKWNEYLDHFGQAPKEAESDYTTTIKTWLERGDDLLADLLQVMGQAVGYDFDKVKIKRGIYFPKGHGEEMNDNYIIRKNMVEIVSGRKAFPVKAMDGQ